MNIQEFFDLPEEQRELLTEMHRKQKEIRSQRLYIETERRKLDTRETNLQMNCEHPFQSKIYKADTDEYGILTGSGTYHFHCPDCDRRWQEHKY